MPSKDIKFKIAAQDNTKRGVDSARRNLSGLSKSVQASQARMVALGAAGAVMGVALLKAARAAKTLAIASAKMASDLTDSEQATGLHTDALQVFYAEAIRAGAATKNLDQVLIRMRKSIADANRGLSTAKDGFAALNIDLATFVDLPIEQQLEEMGKGLVNAKDKTAALGGMMDLLGTRNAPKLLEVIRKLGVEGFDSLATDAEESGQIMARSTAVALDNMVDSWELFKRRIMVIAGETTVEISKMFGLGMASENADAIANSILSQESVNQVHERFNEVKRMRQGFMEDQEAAAAKVASLTEQMKLADAAGANSAVFAFQLVGAQKSLDTANNNVLASTEALTVAKGQLAETEALLAEKTKDTTDAQVHAEEVLNASHSDLEVRLAKLGGTTSSYVAQLRHTSTLYKALAKSELERNGVTAEYVKYREREVALLTEAEKAIEGYTEKTSDATTEAEKLGAEMSSALTNAAINGKAGIDDLAQFVIAKIQQMIAEWMIFTALTAAGNAMGGSFGGMVTNFAQGFGGARAGGGEVKAGKSYAVGEQGVEMFTPSTDGSITSNGKLGGDTYIIDARGADQGAIARLEQQITALNGSIERRALAATSQKMHTSPRFLRR